MLNIFSSIKVFLLFRHEISAIYIFSPSNLPRIESVSIRAFAGKYTWNTIQVQIRHQNVNNTHVDIDVGDKTTKTVTMIKKTCHQNIFSPTSHFRLWEIAWNQFKMRITACQCLQHLQQAIHLGIELNEHLLQLLKNLSCEKFKLKTKFVSFRVNVDLCSLTKRKF